MTELVEVMALPFVACLLLAGIHVYLGIHVLARKVIFVDLSLAQIAAFGAIVGVLLGYDSEHDALAIKLFSLAFTIAGAAIFSSIRMRHERVPQEAFIGIGYAAALSASILASAHLAHGADEMRELLAGNILWIRGPDLAVAAGLYGAVGAFHFVFRRRFLRISFAPDEAAAKGENVRLWDFLFYVSFGFVVTSSVSIAGVLLVFCFLVIPAVFAALFAESVVARLVLGWAAGTLVSFAGVAISYAKDLPSGPTIVVTFAAVLATAGLVYYVRAAENRGRAAAKSIATIAIGAMIVFLLPRLEKSGDVGLAALLASERENDRLIGLNQLSGEGRVPEALRARVLELAKDGSSEIRGAVVALAGTDVKLGLLDVVHAGLSDADPLVRDAAIKAVRGLGQRESAEALHEAARKEDDELLRVELAEALLEIGNAGGFQILVDLMDTGEAELARQDAYEHLTAHAPIRIPFAAGEAPGDNDGTVRPFRSWIASELPALKFDPATRMFVASAPGAPRLDGG